MSVLVGRAPGRLDVMGGIADYSGSLVLQWPIRESTEVRVRFHPSQNLHISSRDPLKGDRTVDVPLALINGAEPPYGELRAWFAASGTRHWAAAAISKSAGAVAIAVSQSTGTVRIFQNGVVVLRIEPMDQAMKWADVDTEPPTMRDERPRTDPPS